MRVTGLRSVPTSLFEPDPEKANEVGVVVADAIVEANQGSCITLVLENPNSEPLCLKKGLTLGAVEPIESVLASQERSDKESGGNSNDWLDQESREQAQVNLVESETIPHGVYGFGGLERNGGRVRPLTLNFEEAV